MCLESSASKNGGGSFHGPTSEATLPSPIVSKARHCLTVVHVSTWILDYSMQTYYIEELLPLGTGGRFHAEKSGALPVASLGHTLTAD